MAAADTNGRDRERRSFGDAGEPQSPEAGGDPGYSAARAHQLALGCGEPGYGYGEDYKRDRSRQADEAQRAEPPAASLI